MTVLAILASAALLLSRPPAVHEARAGAPAGALTFAAASTTAVVRVGTASVPPGGSIVMPVTAEGVPAGSPVAALSIQVSYDPAVLDATACVVDPNHVFGSGFCNLTFEKNGIAPDAVRFNATSASGVSGNPILANITFQALGTSGATSILGVVIPVFADPAGNPIPVSNQDGQLCITPCADADADGVPDVSDNCPNWYNPLQNLPPWPVLLGGGDPDCDGFGTAAETFMGTVPTKQCAADPTANNEPLPDAWPIDFNDNQKVNVGDILAYIPLYLAVAGDGLYNPRYDLNADSKIGLADILSFIPFYLTTCTP